MNEGGYKIRNQAAIHFITFAVVEWVDVFSRKLYRDIVLDSIMHCQAEKGLLLHAWCIMSNHFHLVASAKNHDLSKYFVISKSLPVSNSLKLLARTNVKVGKAVC